MADQTIVIDLDDGTTAKLSYPAPVPGMEGAPATLILDNMDEESVEIRADLATLAQFFREMARNADHALKTTWVIDLTQDS